MTCSPMAPTLDAWDRGDHAGAARLFHEGCAAGSRRPAATFSCCPTIPRTSRMETPGDPFPIPGLHIGEVVAEKAKQDGRTKVGILGTNWTMTGPVYPGALGRRGIDWAVPDEADRQIVHDIIMDELCLGVFTDESRDAYVRDHRQAGRRRLRCGGAGLHRNPAADHAGCVAAADPRFRRGCWRKRRSKWLLASGRCRSGAAGRSARPRTSRCASSITWRDSFS